MRPVILTGIRSNNDLHIGNYFGALKPLIRMARDRSEEYQINLFVPDLHSFTTPIDHNDLYKQTLHNLKLFVAAGLPMNNPSIYLYRQSFIPAHSELAWILSCFTNFGELSRMIQFKEKSSNDKSNQGPSAGLFNYPVLMAADILLYNAEYVSVGQDQSQHLEFTRNLAQRINNRFGEIFKIPLDVAKQHQFFNSENNLKILDLNIPNQKMNKSNQSDKGVIYLSEDPKGASNKILSATTDSIGKINFDPIKQPGISNLLVLSSLFSDVPLNQIINKWKGSSNYADFKKEIAEQCQDFLTTFQEKLSEVKESDVLAKLENDEKIMNQQANTVLSKIQKVVGLR